MLATGASVSIPLPLLNIMLNANGTALAQSNTPLSPLYVTWFFGNGSLPGKWKPTATGTGSAWSLSPQLMPLADFKSYLTVISGLENKLVVGGNEHPTGSAGATTGAGLNGNAVKAASVDQIIADKISTGAPFRSIEVGVTPATPNGNPDSLHTVAHKGPNNRLNAEYDPKMLFTRLFMGFKATGTGSGGSTGTTGSGGSTGAGGAAADPAAKLAGVKLSVLDSIKQDTTALQARLGAADKARLEQHLESIRAIERRLQASLPGTGTGTGAGGAGGTSGGGSVTLPPACSTLVMPTTAKDGNSEAPPAVNTAMADLSTLALACDRTRVLTFMFSLPAAHVYYRHLASDMNDDFHDTICHGDAGDQANQPRVDKGVLYAMKCLAEFLGKMKSMPHGASSLLDQSLVFVTSDTAWGKIHTKAEWPVLYAGKAGGKLTGDMHLNFPSDNLSKALLTAAKLMGSTVTSLGLDVGQATSTLTGLGV